MEQHLRAIEDALGVISELLAHVKEELRLAYIENTKREDNEDRLG